MKNFCFETIQPVLYMFLGVFSFALLVVLSVNFASMFGFRFSAENIENNFSKITPNDFSNSSTELSGNSGQLEFDPISETTLLDLLENRLGNMDFSKIVSVSPEVYADEPSPTLGKVYTFSSTASSDVLPEIVNKAISVAGEEQFKNVHDYITSVAGRFLDETTLLSVTGAIIWYANHHKLPLGLVVGVAQTESSFNPKALSSVGACGTMQVMWNIHKDKLATLGILKREELFDPVLGIKAGCQILADYISKEQTVTGALKRYYGALTANYVGSVLAHWHSYELTSAGYASSWKDQVKEELNNWSKITTASKPSSGTSSSRPRSSSGSGSAKISGTENSSASRTPTLIYNGKGTITIEHGNGKVTAWKDDGVKKP